MNTTVTNNNDRTKEKKEKKKEVNRMKGESVRYSGSSFEAGALSPLESSFQTTVTIKKKHTILGPISVRHTIRNVSTTLSIGPPVSMNRFFVESTHLTLNAAGCPFFVVSSGSSLRPPSTASGVSVVIRRTARSSSGPTTSGFASVCWDEEGLRGARETTQGTESQTRECRFYTHA